MRRTLGTLTIAGTLLVASAIAPAAGPVAAQTIPPPPPEAREYCERTGNVFGAFESLNECVSAVVTLYNQGFSEGVGTCKFLRSQLDLTKEQYGRCVRKEQAGQI